MLKKISNKKKYSTEEDNVDNVQDHGGRILRPMVPMTDWSKCVFCKSCTHRENRELHSVSTPVYHACYVGKRNIEHQASKLEVNACEVSPCYEQAFKKMADEIKKGSNLEKRMT